MCNVFLFMVYCNLVVLMGMCCLVLMVVGSECWCGVGLFRRVGELILVIWVLCLMVFLMWFWEVC